MTGSTGPFSQLASSRTQLVPSWPRVDEKTPHIWLFCVAMRTDGMNELKRRHPVPKPPAASGLRLPFVPAG
jgi:hypothetical protein